MPSTSQTDTDLPSIDAPTSPNRRRMMLGSAGALATSALFGQRALAAEAKSSPLPDYASDKDLDSVIVHSPTTIETKRGAIGSGVVTPTDKLYVRNNLPAPSSDIVKNPDAWSIEFEGVSKPRSMTVAELKSIGITTVAAVLQCSGNGRAFFEHDPSGTQWSTGAAGCAMWTGVLLRDVVEKMGGVAGDAKYITGTGGEELPEGLDPKTIIVERSIPVKALDEAILAWELNDEAIPISNGGPLRLIVPGYFGVNNIKYIKRLAFTPTQTEAAIQASGYRIRPVGEKGAADQPSMWEMPVKSWITSPLEKADKGPTMIHGVAMGGFNALESVEVSVDGGKTWKDAEFLGPDLGRYAWRPFVLAADLKPGEYRMVSRAKDSAGEVQPDDRTPNERGYGNSSWKDHGVTITVS